MRFASAIVLFALTLPADAQQQGSTITLSCNGTNKLMATAAADLKPDPITNLGIIVNAANRTVTFMDYVIPITGITDTLVSFMGRQEPVILGTTWMLGKPAVVLGLVRIQVAEDDMNLPLRMRGENAIHEIEELDALAAAVMPASNFACCDVESGRLPGSQPPHHRANP